eukprot:jgi/Bigna1/141964/aug1.66_g16672
MDKKAMANGWKSIRASLNRGRGVALLVNHVSKLDGLLLGMFAPLDITMKCKTYMKSDLFDAFLTGRIWTLVGHLPVHFKSEEKGVFKVDREKQAIVTQKLSAFMKTGKILIFCPEGQISQDPSKLQPFRRGSFAMVAELGMDVWAFTTHNAQKVWPNSQKMGGFPATLKLSITKLHDGKVEKDDIKGACIRLSEETQKKMQKEVDRHFSGESKQNQ